ncbi:uncharacterized protein LOC117693435 isoform X7 [Arvicanthis niloticus]|uniref:uncharacterized protein LOC117693435 isoform X7 n=1 Tax=Arvicanthis niloticus TaxID=61156 RepID=UPI001487225C|nr:uncharacterized protein LOC117693435 [Arvicanthis niloticus]
MESVEVRRRRLISLLIKTIKEKQAMDTQNAMGPEVHKDTSAETTVHSKKDVPEHTHNPLASDDQKGTPETMESVEERKRRLYSMILKKLEAMQGMQNVPDIKQLFFKKGEFEPHDEGSWEEYQSYFPHGVHVPDSRQTLQMDSTMVESYIAQVGDSDVEEQQEQLDSKENFPDAYEVQRWEMRKRPSTLSPAVNTLFVRRPTSSESDEESTPIRRKKRRNKRHL